MRKPFTVSLVLEWGRHKLAKAKTASLDAELLLAEVLRRERAWFFANPERAISPQQVERFKKLVTKRAAGWPTAYLTGKKDFYGLTFKVSPAVLIPRPASEAIVAEAVRAIKDRRIKNVLELGTGSGAIAVAIAKTLPDVQLVATDISEAALRVARTNARFHEVSSRIRFIKSDLFSRAAPTQLIVANLPYLPKGLKVARELTKEPRQALFDGSQDGLGLYEKMFEAIKTGCVLVELGSKQYGPMAKWLKNKFKNRAEIGPIHDLDRSICGLKLTLLSSGLESARPTGLESVRTDRRDLQAGGQSH